MDKFKPGYLCHTNAQPIDFAAAIVLIEETIMEGYWKVYDIKKKKVTIRYLYSFYWDVINTNLDLRIIKALYV